MRVALWFVALLALPALTTADTPPPEPVYNFTQAQIEKLQDEFEAILHRREKEAFEAGVQYQRQACRSLI